MALVVRASASRTLTNLGDGDRDRQYGLGILGNMDWAIQTFKRSQAVLTIVTSRISKQ